MKRTLRTAWQGWLSAILVIGLLASPQRAKAVADDIACCLNLPPPPASEADGIVTTRFKDAAGNGSTPEQSLFTVDIQPAGGTAGSPTPPIPAGRYAGWCFDSDTTIITQPSGTLFGGYLLPTCDPNRNINQYLPDHPGVKVDAATWKKVNYLINHRFLACNGVVPTMWDVQHAIYGLFNQPAPITGYPTFHPAVVQCLIDSANANAAAWIPKCGDKIATIFNIDVNWDNIDPEVQLIFIEVPCPCTSLGDYVWQDLNLNGIQDEPASAGVNGVTVNLLDCSNNPVRDSLNNPITAVTANDAGGNPGYYLFKNLVAGCYHVQFVLPAGYAFTTQNAAGSNAATGSDADTTTGLTSNINLAYGSQDLTWDAGIYQPAKIGDLVFDDTNANGVQDSGELGVNGVTVELFRCSDNASMGSTLTAGGGLYGFTVAPGSYYVKFSGLPSGYVFSPATPSVASDATDSDANPATGVTDCTDLAAGESDPTWDAGIYQPAKIGDLVFNDTNANGVQDSGELGVNGVTVELFRCSDNASMGSTLTAGGGLYGFTVAPGSYYVKFSGLPSGYVFSPSTPSVASDATDSDANPATGVTDCTDLAAGENDPTWDAGIYQPAKIGDLVFNDTNANGVQDSGELGVNGVTVELFRCSDNASMGSTLTAGGGLYGFTVAPGSYYVKFSGLPSGYVFSPSTPSVASDATDSDANPATGVTDCTDLAAGENDPTWDAGIYQPAKIGDLVFNDTNANGVQDSGELGVNGVTVELFRCSDNASMGSTLTAGGGLYGFTVAPGSYYVKFSGLPSGYVFSPSTPSVASDATDSDANPATGVTDCTDLAAGENDPTWDAGIYQPAKIGDLVFNDTNANGVQDSGELGVNGVTVELFRCSDNVSMGSTLTAGGGLYGFTVAPGSYYVKFSGLPSGFVFSPSTPSVASDATDSDANPATGVTDCTDLAAGENDPTWDAGIYQPAKIGDLVFNDTNANGVQDSGELGVNGVTVELFRCSDNASMGSTLTAGGGLYGFTVAPGSYYVKFSGLPSGYVFSPSTPSVASDATDSDANPATGVTDCTDLAAGESDPTWDAGIYQPAKIGDLVFNDTNANGVQDSGELGVNGVTVELFRCSDNASMGSTLTAGGGLYGFTVAPGSYYVKFSGLPSGYVFSPATPSVASDATDSDANPATGVTDCTDLAAGENDPTWDAGIYQQAKIGDLVFNDTNANGVQDSGELGVNGVTVQLLKCSDNSVVATTTTAGGGLYGFTVAPGSYYVKFSGLPSGYVFSPSTPSVASDATDSDANPATGVTDCTTLVSGENDTTWDAGINKPSTECVPASFAFSGTSALYGNAGNIRTFSAGGVSVKASAFSRNKTTGAWSPAFLGAFSGGLGVTDGTEGTGGGNSHTTDNIGEDNFVLFEFSEPVVVTSAALGYVVSDSDLSLWIGNFADPFNSHLSLNDTVLGSFGTTEENLIDNGGAVRTADFNAGQVIGNALVVAAWLGDTSPEDQFKIAGLGVCKPGTSQPVATIGDKVWNDLNKNGVQETGEPGVDGVKVELFRCADNTLAGTTTTSGGGLYSFTVAPGDYYVKFSNLPAGYVFTSSTSSAASDPTDSDANATTGKTDCTTLAAGETDNSWDAGIYQQCVSSICGFVLRDCNADGLLTGEQGLSGWTVQLKNTAGTVVGTATTGTDGAYCFNNLAAGTYKVVVVAAANYKSTSDFDGTCDGLTSIALASCQAKTGVNFGYTGTAASVSLTKTGPASATCGATVTFTYVVKNTGNTCLYGGMGIDDPLFGGQIFHQTPVYPGESFTVTKAYVVTTANAGAFCSTATAFGHPPGTLPAVYATASWTINVTCQKPSCYPVTPGNCQNTLTWTPCSGATSYQIKRCTTLGGAYTVVKTVSGSSTCTDLGLVNGTHYYYKVCAVIGGSTTPDSDEVCGIPSAGLPSPWSTKDIGTVAACGSATYASGTFTVNGSGDDIWNAADDYRYVYQLASGNCSVVAKVTSVENSNGWTKAGVMIRETLNAGSEHASVFVTPSNGVAFQYRNTTGGASANINTAGLAAPYWVKIVRSSNTFTAYRSADGANWTQVGSTSISMGSSVYIGLAVTSHNDGDIATAKFSNVTATP